MLETSLALGLLAGSFGQISSHEQSIPLYGLYGSSKAYDDTLFHRMNASLPSSARYNMPLSNPLKYAPSIVASLPTAFMVILVLCRKAASVPELYPADYARIAAAGKNLNDD